MDPLFYSPKENSWSLQGPEDLIDPSSVVTMPVRRYTYQNTKYSIMACAELSFPNDIFYMLSVARPNGAEISSTQERDLKIIKQLLKYAPISFGQYKVSGQKLIRKIAKRKRQAFLKRVMIQNELVKSVKADIKDDQIKNEALKTRIEPQPIHIIAADDDSEGFGGILGVYCESGIHGNYRGTCAEVERKIA